MQLAAAEPKEKESGKGKGKGKGRKKKADPESTSSAGRGKGRGKGYGKKKADPEATSSVKDDKAEKKRKQKGDDKDDGDAVAGKRQKKDDDKAKLVEKKAPRKKRSNEEPKEDIKAPVETQPPPKKAAPIKRQRQQASEPDGEIEPINPKSDDGSKDRVFEDVMEKLEAFRGEETKWSSLTALYQAMIGEQPSRGNDSVPKYLHYNLSMYWTKGRVGLLDKEKNHILSFSSASTMSIGLALRATMLYVSCSPCLEHNPLLFFWFAFRFRVFWVAISVYNIWLDGTGYDRRTSMFSSKPLGQAFGYHLFKLIFETP